MQAYVSKQSYSARASFMPAPRRLMEYAAIIALIALAIWFAVENWLPEQMM